MGMWTWKQTPRTWKIQDGAVTLRPLMSSFVFAAPHLDANEWMASNKFSSPGFAFIAPLA